MGKQDQDQYYLKDGQVANMQPVLLERSYDYEIYEGPVTVKLPCYKLTLACPAVDNGLKRSQLENPASPPGTLVPSVEVYVAVYKAPGQIKPTFYEGKRATGGSEFNTMFISTKKGKALLRGSYFHAMTSAMNIDRSVEGPCVPLKGKTIPPIYVKVGYTPGGDYKPRNTFRGYSLDKDFFANVSANHMADLSSAEIGTGDDGPDDASPGLGMLDQDDDTGEAGGMTFAGDEDDKTDKQAAAKKKPTAKKPAKKAVKKPAGSRASK